MSENNSIEQYSSILINIQEAAKQIGSIAPILQAAYFAAISVSDLKEAIWKFHQGNWWYILIFVTPGVFWLASLVVVVQIFIPPLVNPTESERSNFEMVIKNKYLLLRISQYTLIAGLLFLIINVVIYFLFIPPIPKQP